MKIWKPYFVFYYIHNGHAQAKLESPVLLTNYSPAKRCHFFLFLLSSLVVILAAL